MFFAGIVRSFPFFALLFSLDRLQSGQDGLVIFLGLRVARPSLAKMVLGWLVAFEYHFTFFFVLKQLFGR